LIGDIALNLPAESTLAYRRPALRQGERMSALLRDLAWSCHDVEIGIERNSLERILMNTQACLGKSETLGSYLNVIRPGNRIDLSEFTARQYACPASHCSSPDHLNCVLMKRLVSHWPQAIDLWLTATAALAAIAVISLCAQLP